MRRSTLVGFATDIRTRIFSGVKMKKLNDIQKWFLGLIFVLLGVGFITATLALYIVRNWP